MADNFNDPETVLGNAKRQTWNCFKSCVFGDDINPS